MLFLSCVSQEALAQNSDNSIYSRFGLGDPVFNSAGHMRNMGNIGSIFQDVYHVNITNPASYSHLRAVAFDMGMFGRTARISDGVNTQNVQSSNLDYISIAFPLSNIVNEILEREEKSYSLAMAFSLAPFSRVGYNINTVEQHPALGEIERNFQGKGGTYKFLWGNSIRYKSISGGVNLGYIFGNIQYERSVVFEPNIFAFNNVFVTRYNISGFTWNAGVQFSPALVKPKTQDGVGAKKLIFGFYTGTNTSFSTNADVSELGVQQSGRQVNVDTLTSVMGQEGKGTLPLEMGLGIGYQSGEKWLIGVNYSRANWSDYRNDANPEALSDAFRWSVGGFFRPDWASPTSFWKRVYYRYGMFYTSDPRQVNNEKINSYGITFGLGMPFIHQRKISHLSLGIEAGARGKNSPVQESYISVNIGFTFNDNEWFLKRRFD